MTAESQVAAPAPVPSSKLRKLSWGAEPLWAIHSWLSAISGRGAPEGSEGLTHSPCTLYLDSLDGGGGSGWDIGAEAPWGPSPLGESGQNPLVQSGFPTSLPAPLVPRPGPPGSSNCPTSLGNQSRRFPANTHSLGTRKGTSPLEFRPSPEV